MPGGRLSLLLHRLLSLIGIVAIGLLLVLLAVELASFLIQLAGTSHETLLHAGFVSHLLDDILFIFVLIELLKMAVAYALDRKVIHTVLEAALVAILREIVLTGTDIPALEKLGALSLATVAIGVTWSLIRKVEPSGF